VLDIWEGVAGGPYARRSVAVTRGDSGETVAGGDLLALKVGEGLKPTREYLAHLLAGEDLLPPDYHAWLKTQACLD
jgi:hypothetical protein